MKKRNTISIAVLYLVLVLTACNGNDKTQLIEFGKYKDFVEKTNQEGISIALHRISRCGTGDIALLTLRATIESLNEHSQRHMNQVNGLQSKADLDVIKEKLCQSVNDLPLIASKRDLSVGYCDTLKKVDFETLSLEEARIVLKANIILAEKQLRDKILSYWAIDC
jgi:hypothetical protein